MTFPESRPRVLMYQWWRNFAALHRARTLSIGYLYLDNLDEFFWGDVKTRWDVVADFTPQEPLSPPPSGGQEWLAYEMPSQSQRWRLDTNTWVDRNNATTDGSEWAWVSPASTGPTGGFRVRTATQATFTPGVASPTSIDTWGPWSYIWPTDIEEIPLPLGGVKFTARPSVGVTGSLLDVIDGGAP